MTPTARTLKYLRDNGWQAQVVERWIPESMRRLDLFGVIDIVACRAVAAGKGSIMGVQATSAANLAARREKAKNEPRLRVWLEAGGLFALMAWSKKGPRGKRKTWRETVEMITLEDLDA